MFHWRGFVTLQIVIAPKSNTAEEQCKYSESAESSWVNLLNMAHYLPFLISIENRTGRCWINIKMINLCNQTAVEWDFDKTTAELN